MAINKRKNRDGTLSYLVRVRDDFGRWYVGKTFHRMEDAKRHERELLGARDRGERANPKERRDILVGHFFEEWAASRSHRISKGWAVAVVRLGQQYALPKIGRMKLSEVQPQHIGEIIGAMARQGLKDQTRLHVYAILRQMFGDAVEYFGYLDASPVKRRDRPKVHRTERKFLTPDESWKLLNHVRGNYLAPAIWIAILAGLRTGELQALCWGSVELERLQILICAAYKRAIKVIEPYPKGKDWARVPMPKALVEFLRTLRTGKTDDDFVAPGLRGGMLEQKKFHEGLKRLCVEAGVRPVSPHELRHSCAEIWIANGASAEDVRRVLNHKHVETTMRYLHRTESRIDALAEMIVEPAPKLRVVQ